MKKLILIAACAMFAACGASNNNGYKKAHLVASETGTNHILQDKSIDDNFIVTGPDATGLVEIKGEKTGKAFKVVYLKSGDMLNIKLSGRLSEWRTYKGHDIFITESHNKDSLVLIFGDRHVSHVKGLITFSK